MNISFIIKILESTFDFNRKLNGFIKKQRTEMSANHFQSFELFQHVFNQKHIFLQYIV
jgi:hypothetical protein